MNMIFLNIQAPYFTTGIPTYRKEVYYWKYTAGKEVDFLVREGLDRTEAIQVSLDLKGAATREREIKGLLAAAMTFPTARLTIISEDEERKINDLSVSINVTPLWKWLLDENV